MWVATLAQLVEHPPCKRTVVGSSPTGGSIIQSKRVQPVLFCGCAGALRLETYYRAQWT